MNSVLRAPISIIMVSPSVSGIFPSLFRKSKRLKIVKEETWTAVCFKPFWE